VSPFGQAKTERDYASLRRYESEPNMKANVRLSALAWLLLVACNRPDSELFGGTSLPPIGNDSGAVGGQAAGGPSPSGGTSAANNGGSMSDTPAEGGSTPTAGGPSDKPTAGSANTPDNQGMAGAMDAAGGSGEPPKPPEPVCGNGKLEAGEQCDDAGHAGQDGCDSTCKVVCANFGAGTAESEDHHCYNGYDAADFAGAVEACGKRGAHLATISSAAENKIARTFVNNSKWLGGREDVSASARGTGTYAWITDEPFTYTNWGTREPDQAKVRCTGFEPTCYEHCVAMLGDGTWADQNCQMSDGYVCEWEPAGTK
jgi:cysteine-rich repeat protein